MAWAPDYVTATELKTYLRLSDADDDALVAQVITAASRAVDHHCNRQFGTAGGARYYRPLWDRQSSRWTVVIDDLTDDTGMAIAIDTEGDDTFAGAVTLYTLLPRNAEANGRPWTQLAISHLSDVQPCRPTVEEVRVTVDAWGWTAVPTAVKEATMLQAARFYTRRDAPFGVAGSPDTGSELRLLARLDPDVAVSLRAYVRVYGGRI